MTDQVTRTRSSYAGPVAPRTGARGAHKPLGVDQVQVTGGPWAGWQQTNRARSIPLALDRLEKAGNLPNLRAVAEGRWEATFEGPVFADSDVYKTLEAVAWELGRAANATDNTEGGSELADVVPAIAGILQRAQGSDGYLNAHFALVEPDARYTRLEWSHEMYCAGHLIQAAVAAHRTVDDERLLGVARRFADHLVEVFLRGDHPGIDGHPEIETALVELYRVTDEQSYLDLAKHLVETRGYGRISTRGAEYFQDHLPVRAADTLLGHAVRALYLEAGIVDLYVETGDESLLHASIRRWEDMVAAKTYLTGALGSRHSLESFGDRWELPPDRAYAETCAAIASIHWSWRLLLVTGEARYADLIERTLYNAFAASTSSDGERFFYVNPLQRRADHVEGARVGQGRRHEWYSCACCPPNIMRLVASLGHYLASTTEDTLAIHQYAGSTISASVGGRDVQLTVETDYPWNGRVEFRVLSAPEDAGEWVLALRIPAWSRTATITVDDATAPAGVDARGYAVLRRSWRAGETVVLELDPQPRLTFPHQRIDAVRSSVAVEYGPLVYCFEQADQADDVSVEELTLDPATAAPRVVQHSDHPELGRTAIIELDAYTAHQEDPTGLPYSDVPPEQQLTVTRTRTTAVPYYQWDNRDGDAMRVWLPLAPDRS